MTDKVLTLELDGKQLDITHPDKLYWPEEGISKLDLVRYYQKMAPVMLPYFNNRPVTLHIYPRGINETSFYRRNLPKNAPSWLPSAEYETSTDSHLIHLPLISCTADLIWYVNQGSIEFHLWGSQVTHLDKPDWLIFDLDPGDKASFSDVLEAARIIHNYLEKNTLKGFAKTSGGSGLHIYLIAPTTIVNFQQAREKVKEIAIELASQYPDLIQLPKQGTHKGRFVTVDYAQNSKGRNTVAPYSVRAKPGAPISMPVSWDEIKKGNIRPKDFTLKKAPDRAKLTGDLFSPILNAGKNN